MFAKNLRTRLDRLHQGSSHNSQETPQLSSDTSCQKMASVLNGREIQNTAGSYCLIEETLAQDYSHGSCLLEPTLEHHSLSLSAFSAHDQPGIVKLTDLLFVDTETTGLGGAGAVAFLVGVGSIEEGSLEIRQYLLPDYSDEASMLEGLMEEFSLEKTVVSFNGAAFDLPLLRDRLIVNRVARQIPYAHHIDLLHSARRLYRRRLNDCTLVNLERELFEFHRVDDIPGYLVPSVYFDWLNAQRLDQMMTVVRHNRWDIVSLLFLADMISRVFESDGADLEEFHDLHSLARVYGRRKQTERVVELYPAIDRSAGGRLPDDIRFFHSLSFKRAGDIEKAVDLWLSLSVANSREGYLANIELAKHYEHRIHDIDKALKCTQEAKTQCPDSKYQKLQIERRLARLLSKQQLSTASGRNC